MALESGCNGQSIPLTIEKDIDRYEYSPPRHIADHPLLVKTLSHPEVHHASRYMIAHLDKKNQMGHDSVCVP